MAARHRVDDVVDLVKNSDLLDEGVLERILDSDIDSDADARKQYHDLRLMKECIRNLISAPPHIIIVTRSSVLSAHLSKWGVFFVC